MTRPVLKATKVLHYKVTYNDLENFVAACYPHIKGYNFIAVEEAKNDSSHRFSVSGELTDWDLQDWKEIAIGLTPVSSNWVLLNKLCQDGFIEKGEYLITVSW